MDEWLDFFGLKDDEMTIFLNYYSNGTFFSVKREKKCQFSLFRICDV
jgi:hypothetical protein